MSDCQCNMCRGEGAWRRPAVSFLALALLAFTACAADELGDDVAMLHESWCEGVQPHFATRPVQVQLSEALTDRCAETVLGALDFWRARGVSLVASSVPIDAPSLDPKQHVPGVVSVRWTFIDGPVEGEATVSMTLLCDVFDAKVRLDKCTPGIAAHEIGHSLGLAHHPDVGNLMHETIEDMGWDLDADQLAWVADP